MSRSFKWFSQFNGTLSVRAVILQRDRTRTHPSHCRIYNLRTVLFLFTITDYRLSAVNSVARSNAVFAVEGRDAKLVALFLDTSPIKPTNSSDVSYRVQRRKRHRFLIATVSNLGPKMPTIVTVGATEPASNNRDLPNSSQRLPRTAFRYRTHIEQFIRSS